MERFTHKLAAIYRDQSSAREAWGLLRQGGFPEAQLRLVGPTDAQTERKLEPEGEEVAMTVLKDTALGTGIGGALGLAGSAALGAAGLALFLSQPVAATLVIAGYSAGVGGVLGFLKGIKVKESLFVGAAEDALGRGYWVLVVHGRNEDEEKRAQALISETLAKETLAS